MAEAKPHLFLPAKFVEPQSFTTRARGGEDKLKAREVDRIAHGQFLGDRLQNACAAEDAAKQAQQSEGLPTREGSYITFTIDAKRLTNWSTLDSTVAGNISFCTAKPVDEGSTEVTVHIPKGKESKFLNKFNEFATKDTPKGKPKHQKLATNITEITQTVLERSIWQDDPALIPTNSPKWCEVWLRIEEHKKNRENVEVVAHDFFSTCKDLQLSYKDQEWLHFPERVIVLVQASLEDLQRLFLASDRIAEIRAKREPTSFFMQMPPSEQSEWGQDLLERSSYEEKGVTVCLVDTGINIGHPLLEPVIGEEETFVAKQGWAKGDNPNTPHGTLMAGVATYGDLKTALETREAITLHHRLASIKLLPDRGENDPNFYGYLTQDAINRYLVDAGWRSSIFCMAITETAFWGGRPTAWSAAIDQVAFGSGDQEVEDQKLILISAGNLTTEECNKYPETNKWASVESPAQAWNALTVGAYTNLTRVEDDTYSGYTPVAQSGGLSPFSRTSAGWDDPKKWPNKPDLVMEGGNMVEVTSFGEVTRDVADDLSLLTTSANVAQSGWFSTINATSAATALASNLAAKIKAEYPNAWPETIRALMVHTAEWTDQMKRDFTGALKLSNKGEISGLLRHCGYGVPDEARALQCATDHLTLIAQRYNQPYEFSDSRGKTKDMDLFALPWPIEALKQLGSKEVTLKITLSFFIEPGPGERGWNSRYRYASHGFRYQVKLPSETRNDFLRRVNKEAEDLDEEKPPQDKRWVIGTTNRNRGTVQSDWFTCTAQDLAACDMIAIYPIVGWWRERHHLGKVEQMARYSLVVSIKSEESEIDLYTPVATQIGIKVPTPITT